MPYHDQVRAAPPLPEPPPAAPVDEAASEPPSGEPLRVDQVFRVTGSRLKQAETRPANHLITVDAPALRATSATTLDEALRRMPSVSLQGINKNLNNGGRGLAFVDLRNLGAARTLVLLNGRRIVPTGTGAGEAVDLNNIPLALVKRVEVLLDGASAIYGADAVGGVINVLMHDDFEGVRAETFGGISGRGDAEEIGGSITYGKNHGRGNLTIHVEGLARAPVAQRDRSWARGPVVQRGDPMEQGSQTIYGDGASPAGGDESIVFVPANGMSFRPAGPEHRYQYGRDMYLVASMQRLSTTMLATYDLDDSVRAFLEAGYVYRRSRNRLSPDAFYPSGTRTFPDGLLVPVDNPLVPRDYLATLGDATSFPLTRTNVELGNRVLQNETHASRLVLGVAGDYPDMHLDWEIYANLGVSRAAYTTTNVLNYARARETVDPTVCAANAIRGCMLGDYFGAGRLQPEVIDYIRYTDMEASGYSHLSSGASLSVRPFAIRGERVGVATGVLFRREAGFTEPSAVVASGDSSSNAYDPTRGSFRAVDAYAELNLPLLARLPGFDLLRADAAVRYTRDQGFGSAFTYRFGALYAPLRDVSVRASHATAFRAPGVIERFSGEVESYAAVADPCSGWASNPDIDPRVRQNCIDLGVPENDDRDGLAAVSTNIGGNRSLEPETAKVLSIGAKVSPQFRDGRAGQLIATLNYYRLRIDHQIGQPPLQDLVDTCHRSPGLSGETCRLIQRDNTGRLARVNGRLQNLEYARTSGIDAAASYRLPLRALGANAPFDVTVAFSGHRLLVWDERSYEGSVQRRAGTIARYGGSYAHWRWNLSAAIAGSGSALITTLRHLGHAQVHGAAEDDPVGRVPAVYYWDLVASYTIRGTSMMAGVTNLLDRAPPFLLDYSTNSSPQTYDYVGRFFFARLRHQL